MNADYPMALAGAHGRIDAYRYALKKAGAALETAVPYINGVALDSGNAPWRRSTAHESLAEVNAALDLLRGELAVTNP